MLLLLTSTAQGQDSLKTVSISEVRKNNFQIELGLRSFKNIWDGTASGTLLFKKKVNFGELVEVNALRFLRGYFTLNTQTNFTDDPTHTTGDTSEIYYHPADRVNFSVGLGLEKQNKGKLLVHYHGLDLFTQYFKTDDDVYNGEFGGITVNIPETSDHYVQTLKVGVMPFIGAKFYLTTQISLGLEAGMEIAWFQTKFTEVEFDQQYIDNKFQTVFVKHEPIKSKGISTRFNGVRFVTLGYTF